MDRTAPVRILWAWFGLFPALSESLQRQGLVSWAAVDTIPPKAVPIPWLLVMTYSHPASPTVDSAAGAPAGHERLAEQLHTLSQVVETITYRLLELEERLGEQECQLQALQQQTVGAAQLSDGAEQRFDDTEERLVHLESLLNGMAPTSAAGAARHLQPVRTGDGHRSQVDQPATIDGPFLEEPEQPFMDDVEAPDSQLDLEELEDLTA